MAAADGLLKFVNDSPSPFHAVKEAAARLEAGGYARIRETDSWEGLERGGRYYFTRNQSTLFAFAVPKAFSAGKGFNIVAAHTDSPCLKVKPVSKQTSVGWQSVGVQTYGGGIWHTWFDRDLAIAGRVVLEEEGRLCHRLVRVDKPLMRIPTLCIHLDRSVNTEGFKFNAENQLLPVLATEDKAKEALLAGAQAALETEAAHQPLLLRALAEELHCEAAAIKDFELCLYDHTKAARGGVLKEFLFAPRLDNLFSSYCALEALLGHTAEGVPEDDQSVSLVALYDNEEVGSVSANGANSNLMEHVVSRVTSAFRDANTPAGDSLERAIRASFLVSADMAHAVHPAYVDKHEARHRPALHKGAVIKQNANQRYATSAVTGALLRELAKRNNVPIQEFVVRNDSACGSTIGPCLSSRGFRTVDVGSPQLSMHSIREMCGADDVQHTLDLFAAFFKGFNAIDAELIVD